MNQARALGQHWANTPVTTVYCSDLKRAHSTAEALVAGQAATGDASTATPIVSPLLREQNFGVAEGKLWAATPESSPHAKSEAEQVYYTIRTRHDKFEDGESLDDLAERADQAIDKLVWPHVVEALMPQSPADAKASEARPEEHIVLVSHGLAISELVAALLRRSPVPPPYGARAYKGLQNTGWTQLRIEIGPADEETIPADAPKEMEIKSIYVESINNAPHLTSVKRQGGGIGSSAHDEKQRGIREFFGGGNA